VGALLVASSVPPELANRSQRNRSRGTTRTTRPMISALRRLTTSSTASARRRRAAFAHQTGGHHCSPDDHRPMKLHGSSSLTASRGSLRTRSAAWRGAGGRGQTLPPAAMTVGICRVRPGRSVGCSGRSAERRTDFSQDSGIRRGDTSKGGGRLGQSSWCRLGRHHLHEVQRSGRTDAGAAQRRCG
jgi:hypothetical protein